MATRFYDSELWNEKWFRTLHPDGKLLYLFLVGMADIAGFWEIDAEALRFYTGLSPKRMATAWDELSDKLVTNGKYVWMPDFIIRQKNWPLNKDNKAHQGIIARLEARKDFSPIVVDMLSGKGLPSPYEGAEKGLFSPTSISISNGISKSNGSSNKKRSLTYNKNKKQRTVRDTDILTNPDIRSIRNTNSVSTRIIEKADEVIDYLNESLKSPTHPKGGRFRHSKTSRKPIRARLSEGATVEDLKLIIDHKVALWLGDPEWEGYLNPETLFRPTKFERNLNAAIRWAEKGRPPLNKKAKVLRDLEAARRFANGKP